MSTRLGTSLPMIFVKGQPAKLHDMTLDQLRKFVPFLVKSVTRKDLPNNIDGLGERPPPAWWPKDLEFSKAVLHAKLPNRDQVKRLVRAVSKCYAEFNSTYLIAFSSSLATKNGSKEFGKLTYAELTDGTTRILNGQGQLVVVIRTATRYYDRGQKMTEERENRRRSARLQLAELNGDSQHVGPPASTTPSTSAKFPKIVCRNLAIRLEDCDPEGVEKRKISSSPIPKKQPIATAQPSSSRNSKPPQVLTNKPIRRGIKRKKGAVYNPVSFSCNECGKYFEYSDLLNEHQPNCLKLSELSRKNESVEKSSFLAMMGLVPSSSLPSTCVPHLPDQPYAIPPSVSTAKGRPKRTCQKQFSRTELGRFVKNQPILPLTSDRGKKLLQAHNAWSPSGKRPIALQNPSNEAYKYLSSKVTKAPRCPEPQVVTTRKHKFGDDQYAHVYSYSKAERQIRNVELVLGMNTEAFELYRQCRPCYIKVEKLPDAKFCYHSNLQAQKKANRRAAQMKLLKRGVIKLIDILDHPETVPPKYQKVLKSYIPYKYQR